MSIAGAADSRASETRSSEELLALALSESDEDNRWDYVRTLHYRGGQTEFDLAAALSKSDKPIEREVGADILGQLGYPSGGTFHSESVDLLLEMLNDADEDVLYSVVCALGHHKQTRAIAAICRFADHPNSEIRWAVVVGLGNEEDALSIKTLIGLTTDEEVRVRDWATFELGSQIETDTPEIREALFARATDEDGDTRGEAIAGLAVRKDERAFELITIELQRGDVGTLTFEAAANLADQRLLPYLNKQREDIEEGADSYWLHTLDDAIKACSSSEMSR